MSNFSLSFVTSLFCFLLQNLCDDVDILAKISFRRVRDFVCPRCVGEDEGGNGENDGLVVDGGVLEEVQQFCYLGDVLDCEAGVERAVRARVAVAWRRWQEMASLLVNHSIILRSRGSVYKACVRSALLYGVET